MTKFLKIMSTLLSVALAMVCIVLALIFGSMSVAKAKGEALPVVFGWGNAMVMSGSMQPTLPIGSMLIIHEQDSYNPNDIITYVDNSTLVTHRLISIDGDSVIAKGDANNTEDSPIKVSQIKGKVVAVLPNADKVLFWIDSPVKILIVLLIGITVEFLMGRLRKQNPKKNKS